MARPAPAYIPVIQLQSMPIRHGWDDRDPYPALGEQDDVLMEQLAELSDRAKKAFTIACAEWVVYRLAHLDSDPAPLDYIEASWAGLTDWEIAYIWEPDSDAWQGPVRGPLDMAVRTITNCHYALGLGGGEGDGAFAVKLALYIIPDPKAFQDWLQMVVPRLQKLYPRDENNPMGEPVPREAMDPAVQITPELAEQILKTFLDGLDFAKNEFLVPPGERSSDEAAQKS
jgi:hypothetical protein